jgi:hypothetical protein
MHGEVGKKNNTIEMMMKDTGCFPFATSIIITVAYVQAAKINSSVGIVMISANRNRPNARVASILIIQLNYDFSQDSANSRPASVYIPQS